jgi:hypothetical protein
MLRQVAALKGRLKAAWAHFRQGEQAAARVAPGENILDQYVHSAPCPQNALDIFQGEWTSCLPGSLANLRAGSAVLFDDARIRWAAEQLGGFQGQHLLELGPLEAGHTYTLEQLGAASVVAVEANTRAYLKCLVVKELLQLRRARFLCGDFLEFLRGNTERFDACIASGVLYHVQQPLELLRLLARTTDRLFLWTHYFDGEAIRRDPNLARHFPASTPAEDDGFPHILHRYEYLEYLEFKTFTGGSAPFANWLSRGDILGYLKRLGFTDLRVGFEEPIHPHGPSFAVAARRDETKEAQGVATPGLH